MTPAEAVRELFACLPVPGKDLVWLADELIGIVQHAGSVTLEVERDEADGRSLACRSEPSAPALLLPGSAPLRLFRPLLARLAAVGSDETGTQCNPYGDRFVLVRSSRSGPVRLEVEFTNTPASQKLNVTRVPVAGTRVAAHPTGGVSPPETQPSA